MLCQHDKQIGFRQIFLGCHNVVYSVLLHVSFVMCEKIARTGFFLGSFGFGFHPISCMRLQRVVFNLAKCLQALTALGAVGERKILSEVLFAILVEMT